MPGQKIEHAGYTRYILQYNPRRFDEEGFELESEDEDSEADREAEEKNPYSGIRIEGGWRSSCRDCALC